MAQPFQRVWVDYMLRGTSRISWSYARHFLDRLPATWSYQLQVSEHGTLPPYTRPDDGSAVEVREDDWTDVGTALVNAPYLTDTVQRSFGKTASLGYRVKLTTPDGVYYSMAANTLGALNKQDWLRAQEIARKELLLHKKATSTEGYLLRRKRNGAACTRCLDPRTGEVTLSKCTVCKGTRFVDGYFAAVPAVFCRVEPNPTREKQNLQTGTEKQDTTQGRLLAVPGLESYDVWVDKDSDLRHYIHVVGPIAQIRSVPLVLNVELRQAPFSDVIYTIDLAGG